VTLAGPAVFGRYEFSVRSFGFANPTNFRALAKEADVVITQPQRVDVAAGLHSTSAKVIYDLYVPAFVEYPQSVAQMPVSEATRAKLITRNQMEYAIAVACADAVLAASTRQRDHWLGALGQAGRLTTEQVPSVAVVPFGVADQPVGVEPTHPIRGSLVPQDSIIALWAGGIHEWFDVATVIAAFRHAVVDEPRLRLVFLGTGHPGSDSGRFVAPTKSRAALDSSTARALIASGHLVFASEWVPYDQRWNYLSDADIAVSAHYDTLETEFSFRTRFLDHLWAGLPTITTSGGALVNAMVEAGAAVEVPAEDVQAWTSALLALTDQTARQGLSDSAVQLADYYRWPIVTEPLAELVAALAAGEGPPRRRPSVSEVAGYLAVATENRIRSRLHR
jgi:glycosyltransferase involved in cell wall biosynthesis